VTVRFLCYENTAQVGCLRLMGKKLLVSMALEGKFCDSGLQAMDDGADVLTTLARELVMQQGVGQSADEVWRALQMQQAQNEHSAVTPAQSEEKAPVAAPRAIPSLAFGGDAPARRRIPAPPSPEQLPLF
jgi:hypothetical protein